MTASYRPLIAVVAYHLGDDRVARWRHGGYAVPAPYVESLRRAGARTAILAPGEDGEAEELLEPFDGLLLLGGGDVDPARYGAEPDVAHNYGVEPDRDALEIELLRTADLWELPALCVCRGMQVLNVAFGGTLHQHLPEMPGMLAHGVPALDTRSLHDVRLDPRSKTWATTKTTTIACSSHHHQGVDRVGRKLRATGWSSDGLVEAIEREVADPESLHWMVGIQWHPEDTAHDDPAQQSWFDVLANLARIRGTRARPGETHGRNREYGLDDPDPAWPARYQDEAGRIRAALGDRVVRLEHVGSTSVPGLAAKPIVDIQLSLASLEPRQAYVAALAGLGYRHVADGIEPDHEYFSREDDGRRAFQIHACRAGSDWERRHLAFRDWLRVHPDDARAYEDLKRHLASAHPRDLMTYVDGKTPFIREIEDRALAGRPSVGPGFRERD